MALTSKERLLRTIEFEPTDYVPLCVLLWDGLQTRCRSQKDRIRRELDLGLDTVAWLPPVPWEDDPRVEIKAWKEDAKPYPILHKVYVTPAGDLEAIVQQTRDWPHGDDIPLLSDFNIPRSRKFLVTGEQDLEPLRYLLGGPSAGAADQFRREAKELKRLADDHALAVVSPAVRLADTVCWLCGPIQLATWSLTQPEFLAEFIRIVAEWQSRRAELYLQERPDIRLRAEWYASPFLSPDLFDKFLSPALQQDIEMAHSVGAKYCYVGTANMMPYLDALKGLGVDALYGVDPIEGAWDLPKAKAECQGQMCLWGGMNGYLQVVHASPADVERAAESAMQTLAPGGGFILCPVDDIGLAGTDQDSEETWQKAWSNVLHMVDAWKRSR